MSKATWKQGITNWTPRCIGCHKQFIGPGERCPACRDKLRNRKRRKPR